MGGKGGGGKKGGGGGGAVDVEVDSESDSTTTLDIVGLDDINVTATTTNTTTNTQRLEVPDVIRTRTEMAVTEPLDTRFTISVPDPIQTDQRQRNELAITEPIVTQMSTDLDVDVKPVVVDLCLTLGVKDPPRFCLSRPYDRRFGLSLFGREVVGVEWSGSTQFIVDDVRPGGFLAGLTDRPSGRHDDHHHHDHHDDHHHDHHHDHHDRGSPEPGVRVVID